MLHYVLHFDARDVLDRCVAREDNEGMTIYTITGLHDIDVPPCIPHTFGWIQGLNMAEWMVSTNEGNISEDGYYQYVVIEGWPRGLNIKSSTEVWYEWDKETRLYVHVPKPQRFKDVVHFAMG